MQTAIVYRGYIGIMEKKMETTIVDLGASQKQVVCPHRDEIRFDCKKTSSSFFNRHLVAPSAGPAWKKPRQWQIAGWTQTAKADSEGTHGSIWGFRRDQ